MKRPSLEFAKNLLRTTPFKRKAFFLAADMILIVVSIYGSFWMRFGGAVPFNFRENLVYYSLLALAVKLPFFGFFNLYNISWRFFSLRESLKLFQALTLSSLTFGLLLFFLKTRPAFVTFPRSILLLDYIFSMGLIGTLRISKRVVREFSFRINKEMRNRTKILIIGAGSTGEQIAREMMNSRRSIYFPVGYIDDDPAKKGIAIHGIKVLGTRKDIKNILTSNSIEEVLVAIPTANSSDIRNIVESIRDSNQAIKIKILPGIIDLIDGNVTLSDIKEVQVEDLLGREPVEIDFKTIRSFLTGKRVLITGAGGSIGSELARSVLQFEPEICMLLDIDETELFYLVNRLKTAKARIVPCLGNICDSGGIKRIFDEFSPNVVFHAAALKHVPILEYYPDEAVKTNILGTKILGEQALRSGVERFINISTDKAINPTSIMGATKRISEELLKTLNERNGTHFISVRFGNVLGSRGSVIPLFKEQIRKGGPVTVTHPEVKRYFMAPSEAVLLVLEAAAIGEGGEAYVLDMGEPVKIADLAKEMIRLSGFEPDVDIPIVYTGLRAGEKLFEELLGAEEGSEPTDHVKIFKVRSSRQRDEKEFKAKVERLIEMCANGCRRDEAVGIMVETVPTYRPDRNVVSICHW